MPRRSPAERAAALLASARRAGVPLPDPLWLPPEVHQRAAKELGRAGTPRQRLERLSAWLSSERGLGFRYDDAHTRTASEAWRAGAGDCLSYAHLFNALARGLGVEAGYVQYRAPQEYAERERLFVVVTHVASLHEADRESILVELRGEAFSAQMSDYQRLGDDEALALHLSNLAMEHLRRDELALAERLMRLTAASAPHLPELQVNLGAVLLRAGRAREALALLRRALKRFPRVTALYTNAALAARATGQRALAERLTALADAPWTDPFVPFVRATALFEQGRFAEAAALFRQVAARDPHSATFQIWLARALHAVQQPKPARAAFDRARALDPRHPQLERLRVELGVPLAP